jgi:hypothetical protein
VSEASCNLTFVDGVQFVRTSKRGCKPHVGFPTSGPHAVSDVVGSARDDELGIFLCVRKLKPETSSGFFFVLCLHHGILNIGMPHRNGGCWGGCRPDLAFTQSARD